MTGARELCKAESRCFRVFCIFKKLVCMKLHRRRRNAHAEHGAGRVLDHQTRFFFERFFLKAPLLQTFPRPVAGRRRIKASWENRSPLKCSKICVAALSGDSAARPTGWTTGLHQSGGVVHFVFFQISNFPSLATWKSWNKQLQRCNNSSRSGTEVCATNEFLKLFPFR